MNFPSEAPVTRAKLDGLRARLATLGIELGRIDEQAIRASGPGGQKVNKTSSGVLLRYPLGAEQVLVKWTRERHRSLNRFLALRELCDEIEVRISPGTSERLKKIDKVKKQKDRVRRRQKGKLAPES